MGKSFDLVDFEKSIGPWLGKTVKIVDYYLQEAFQNAGLDLTKEQMIVLKKLHEKDGRNQNELAILTYRDKSSLARLLSKMESKKYVIRKQGLEDKRSKEVFLTEEGRETFKRTRPVIKSVMDVMEEDVSAKEKQQIIRILKKVQFSFTAKAASL